MGLLLFTHPAVAFGLGFLGSVIKYPFALVPFTLGAVHFVKGNRRHGLFLVASSGTGLVTAFLVTQYLFQDVSHFSLFHVGTHSGTSRRPLVGFLGTFLHPSDGLLLFFSFPGLGDMELSEGRNTLFAGYCLFPGPCALRRVGRRHRVFFALSGSYASTSGRRHFTSSFAWMEPLLSGRWLQPFLGAFRGLLSGPGIRSLSLGSDSPYLVFA